MCVIHVAPTAFGTEGLFGGGERFPLELARAVAQHVSCELVTFVKRTWYGRPIAVSELLGLVALEAMASRAPVIASRVGGLPEIFDLRGTHKRSEKLCG